MAYLSESDIEQLREAFTVFDKDSSGAVTKEEFKTVLDSLGIRLQESLLDEIITRVDINCDGMISFNEFIGLVSEKYKEPENELELIEVFKIIDRDCDGRLSKQQLRAVIDAFHIGMTQNELDLLFQEADEHHQGYISYEEYLRIMRCL